MPGGELIERRALAAEGAGKTYPGGVRALRDASLSIAAGETVALVGASGSGKTTLLRMFNRMVEPTEGRVLVGGASVVDLDPIELRRHTGYVQQEGGLLPHWTVGRNVALVPELLGWPPARRAARADELLDLVGLDPATYRERRPRSLSGGQRQRVALARALAAEPGVILLDEPFGALDALTRVDMQDEFLRLKRRVGATMVLVTHDLREALRLADRIAVLRDGRILQTGDRDELLRSPADEWVATLFSRVAGEPQ